MGSLEHIRSIGRPHLQAFFDAHYHAANTTILLAGPQTHEAFLDLVVSVTPNIPVSSRAPTSVAKLPLAACVQDTYFAERITEELELHYQLPALAYRDKETLQLILELMNEPRGGPLWIALRQQAKAAYRARAVRNFGLGSEQVRVELPIAKDKFPLANEATHNGFHMIREGAFDPEVLEIVRARKLMQYADGLSTPSPKNLLNDMENGWLEDLLPYFAVEREPVVRSITREDLIAFANTHLNQEPFARIERVRRP
jgi:predicted Zn-dependent peptidase